MAIESAMILRRSESTKEEITRYLQERLPDDSKFSDENIKIREIWFNWKNFKEVPGKENNDCERTRNITIKRSTTSKVGEGFTAFWSSFFDINRLTSEYNLDRADVMYMKTAVEELFSEEALGPEKNTEKIKKIYVNCRNIEYWASLEDNRNIRGPILTDSSGIGVACTAGKVSSRVLGILLSIVSIGVTVASKLKCTII